MAKAITKKEIAAKLEELKALPGQDETGRYEVGSEDQQYAARQVDVLLTEGVTIDASLVAKVLLAMQDIQVRDYALGLATADNFTHYQQTFKWLTKIAPPSCKNAPASILAVTYYESDELDKAKETLALVPNKNYSLAHLLNRMFLTGWPTGAFASMRMELHPKVTAGIFGKETDDNKE